MRILIAEDDPSTRYILQRKLEEMEHDVDSFPDGKEAWNALQNMEMPQIALIDWEMPNMTGIELVERIRSDDRIRSMYIIMLTVRDETRDVLDCFQTGVDYFISKPLDIKELRMGLEHGKRMIRSGLDFDERQDMIMENVYDFFEGKGRFEGA